MLFLKNNLAGLLSNTISNSASNAINKFEKIIGGKEPERTGKGFTLFISNEDIIKVVKQKEVGFLVVSTFGCFSGTNSGFFSGKRCHWKKNHENTKRII